MVGDRESGTMKYSKLEVVEVWSFESYTARSYLAYTKEIFLYQRDYDT